MLSINDKAPDFSLPVSNETNLSLASLQGKFIVLYFYPKDDTPGCTVEAQQFSSLKPEFDKLGAVIIGVSKDSLESHAKFKTKCLLDVHLASDRDSNICEAYGVFGEKSMMGIKYMGIQRATFLIGKDGAILHIWPKVSAAGHAQEALSKLKEIIG